MAFDNDRWTLVAATASGDLSSHQFKFVVSGASGIALNTADGGEVDGVLTNKPAAAGRAARVAIVPSVAKVKVGTAVAKGALVKSDASGTAETAGAGEFAVGRALSAGDAGDIIPVQLLAYGNV